jgi:Flp pilus assembly pilin Flp
MKAADKKEFGGGLFEYMMLVALIAIVALASVKLFGRRLACTYNFINYAIDNPQLSVAEARAGQPGMTIGGQAVNCATL